jgi:hypothetical protein
MDDDHESLSTRGFTEA